MPDSINLTISGASGLKETDGRVEEEFHPRLRGDYGPKLYREMTDNSAVIGAVLFLIKALVRQVEWRVEPSASENTEQAKEWAAFMETVLDDMDSTFEDFVSEVLSMLSYGWSYFEIVYKLRKGETSDLTTKSMYDDGKYGWRRLALRAQDTLERWEFDEASGDLKGMHQLTSDMKSYYIPYEKAMLFRTETTKENPEGRSIFRNAVNDYFFLKRICEIEAIGIERDMTGLLVMEVPPSLLQSDAPAKAKTLLKDLETMLSQLKRDQREYAIIPAEVTPNDMPSGFKLKLLSTGGTRQINTTDVKMYYKINILQSVLAQFLQLGMTGLGSFALASSQTNVFSVALGSYMDVITSVLNRFGIAPLMKVNGVDKEYWPEVVHGDIEAPPLNEIGQFVQTLATAGQLPEDDSIKRKLLEMAGLPIPENVEGQEIQKNRKKGGLKCGHHGKTNVTNIPLRNPNTGTK